MNQQLFSYLNSTSSPEYTSLLLEAYDVLSSLGVESHELIIDGALSCLDDMESFAILELISSTLIETLQDQLKLYNVSMGDPDIGVMTDIMLVLANIDSYGDPQTIIDIIDGSENTTETLCELMPLFTSRTPTDVLPFIETVDRALLIRIKTVCGALLDEYNVEPAPETQIPLPYIRSRLKTFVETNPATIISGLIRSGYPIGLEAMNYVDLSIELLPHLTNEDLVNNLLGLIIGSDTADSEILPTAVDLIETIHSDPNRITQVRALLNKGN